MKAKIVLLILFLLGTLPAWAQSTTHSVTLTWDDLENGAGTVYNVYRSDRRCDQTPVFTRIATGVAGKTYIDTPVQVGNFCYTATAYLNDIESDYAIPVTTLVRPFTPKNTRTTEVK